MSGAPAAPTSPLTTVPTPAASPTAQPALADVPANPYFPHGPSLYDEPELARDHEWQRLDPRMLLVHPVRELVRFLPVLVALLFAGSASGDGPPWHYLGVRRPDRVRGAALPDHRVPRRRRPRRAAPRAAQPPRAVDAARPRAHRRPHRLPHPPRPRAHDAAHRHRHAGSDETTSTSTGCPSTAHESCARAAARSPTRAAAERAPRTTTRPVRHLRPLLAAVRALHRRRPHRRGRGVRRRCPSCSTSPTPGSHRPRGSIAVPVRARRDPGGRRAGASLVVPISVVGYLVTNSGFRLSRADGSWHVVRGLLTTRETSLDEERVAGVSLGEAARAPRRRRRATSTPSSPASTARQPGSASLVPPAPRDVVAARRRARCSARPRRSTAPLRAHGPAAVRRRWTARPGARRRCCRSPRSSRPRPAAPGGRWSRPCWSSLAAAYVAPDRATGLGHTLVDGYLVARSGSLPAVARCWRSTT